MPRSIILSSWLLLALLSFKGLAEAQATGNNQLNPANEPGITFDVDPPVTGSGSGKVPFSDDEDFGESGSGSGSGQGDLDTDVVQTPPTTKVTTLASTSSTRAPLSACELMQQTNLMMSRQYVPNCVDGVYGSTQCYGKPQHSDCYCSDKIGMPIPGTTYEAPNVPDCDNGSNMSPCLYQLVMAIRKELLGSPKPQCTSEGQFHPIQCRGSVCYCVDRDTGVTDSTTIVHRPDIPQCDDDMAEPDSMVVPLETDESHEEKINVIKFMNNTDFFDPDSAEEESDNNFDIDDSSEEDDQQSVSEEKDNNNNNNIVKFGGDDSEENKVGQDVNDHIGSDRLHDKETKIEAANRIMSQPGLLAGVIGGSVVLALCLVLLIMFIIYRMRKKDEGSYPLEEPRKPPKYPYMRAPEREFYA